MAAVVRRSSRAYASLLAQAVAAHRAGDLATAEERYRALLRRWPRDARVHANLGAALRAQGRLAEAASECREAIALDPALADAHHNLGNALAAAGDFDAAVDAFERAAALVPDDADTRSALADASVRVAEAHLAAGRCVAAVAACRRVLASLPQAAPVHATLGNALRATGQPATAIEAYRTALALAPENAAVYSNLGLALGELGDMAGALASHRHAVTLDPDLVEAYVNLSSALLAEGDLAEAEATARRGLAAAPNSGAAHNNLGSSLEWQGRLKEALAEYRAAVALAPDWPPYHVNLTHALLSSGALAEGWREHDWRWRDPQFTSPRRPFTQDLWDGRHLDGGSLLVSGEQGIGDEVLFASVMPDALAAAGHCVFECEPRLVPLFARSFPAVTVVARSDPPDPRTVAPDVVARLPAGDLPRLFRKRFSDFPRSERFLTPDPDRVAGLRARLRSLGPGPYVGLAWRTLRPTVARSEWYADLARWAPVLDVPGVTFVSLQASLPDTAAPLAVDTVGASIKTLRELDLLRDLDGCAALIAALDLVIAHPCSIPALAGALGQRTWLLLSAAPNWRWFRDRDDSPWFPSLELYRQTSLGRWDEVFTRVARKLETVPQNSRVPAPSRQPVPGTRKREDLVGQTGQTAGGPKSGPGELP